MQNLKLYQNIESHVGVMRLRVFSPSCQTVYKCFWVYFWEEGMRLAIIYSKLTHRKQPPLIPFTEHLGFMKFSSHLFLLLYFIFVYYSSQRAYSCYVHLYTVHWECSAGRHMVLDGPGIVVIVRHVSGLRGSTTLTSPNVNQLCNRTSPSLPSCNMFVRLYFHNRAYTNISYDLHGVVCIACSGQI